jgi:predicted  nucleic acid-binding Zn-ribbon protein
LRKDDNEGPSTESAEPGNKKDVVSVSEDPDRLPTKKHIDMLDFDYCDWQEGMKDVDWEISGGKEWDSPEVRKIFVRLKMLPWWYSVCDKLDKDGEIDWKKWKDEMLRQTMNQYPEELPVVIGWMTNDIERLLRPLRPAVRLNDIVEESEEEGDVEMEEKNAPEDPRPPPDSPANLSSIANRPENDAKMIEEGRREAFNDLSSRVGDLKRQADTVLRGLKEKVEKLGSEIFDAKLDLDDIRWRTGNLEDDASFKQAREQRERITKSEGGVEWKRVASGRLEKRGRAKNSPKKGARYDIADGEAKGRPRWKDRAERDKRIKKAEERIETQEKEMADLREKLAEAEALATRVDKLRAEFQTFQSNQMHVNFARFEDVHWIRDHVSKSIDPKLVTQAREIASLNTQYQAIFTAAVNAFGYNTITNHLIAAQKPAPFLMPPPPPPPYLTPKKTSSYVPAPTHRGVFSSLSPAVMQTPNPGKVFQI